MSKKIIPDKSGFYMVKCLKCPYKLGFIKCETDPCPQCMKSKSKKHPFVECVIKNEYDSMKGIGERKK